MVMARSSRWSLLLVSLLAVGCQTVPAVTVFPSFSATPALATLRPADIAVMPVEDATGTQALVSHLLFLRHEIIRQLPDRQYSPLTATTVDAAMRGNPDVASARASGGSMLEPATLRKLAGHSTEQALFALRVERWDEAKLMSTKRIEFQCQAALVASDGQMLWSGSINGNVKAGGAGPSPMTREAMVRSCGELMVREILLNLPIRQP